MITIAQIKAARLFLGWEQADLAEKSRISLPTVQRIENPKFGPGRSRMDLIERLVAALEAGGVELIAPDGTKGRGVRLASREENPDCRDGVDSRDKRYCQGGA